MMDKKTNDMVYLGIILMVILSMSFGHDLTSKATFQTRLVIGTTTTTVSTTTTIDEEDETTTGGGGGGLGGWEDPFEPSAGVCPVWRCTEWSSCVFGKQYRNCWDASTCTYKEASYTEVRSCSSLFGTSEDLTTVDKEKDPSRRDPTSSTSQEGYYDENATSIDLGGNYTEPLSNESAPRNETEKLPVEEYPLTSCKEFVVMNFFLSFFIAVMMSLILMREIRIYKRMTMGIKSFKFALYPRYLIKHVYITLGISIFAFIYFIVSIQMYFEGCTKARDYTLFIIILLLLFSSAIFYLFRNVVRMVEKNTGKPYIKGLPSKKKVASRLSKVMKKR